MLRSTHARAHEHWRALESGCAMSARAWRRLAFAFALLLAGLLIYWDPRSQIAPRSLTPAALEPEPNITPVRPRQTTPTAPACEPRADTRCERGDVYWLDSCGKLTELAEHCGGRGCSAGRCQPLTAAVDDCGKVTAYGECNGALAQACVNHKLLTYDCGPKQR